MKKVIIAIDSFKGSLSSSEAAAYIEQGVLMVYPEAQILKIPVADGGEGTVESLVEATQGVLRTVSVSDPVGRSVSASYGILGDGITSVMEMASASGLPLLSPSERNPMLTSTLGTGELILSALESGCRNFLIGIGGSATNDAGTGMLEALGYRFFDVSGERVRGCGGNLSKIVRIDDTLAHPALKESSFTVACDVNNPFYGPNGAAFVFAPQKGATPEMVKSLDEGLKSFSMLISKRTNTDLMSVPGSGAAGGLGGAFYAFLQAELKPGIDMVLDAVDFDSQICGADLIFTGEGRMDSQTVCGKTPYGVLQRAKLQHIPVVALCGAVTDFEVLNEAGFQAVFSIQTAAVSLERAMEKNYAGANLAHTTEQILRVSHK
ncbi:MAG: glycerate kinase family protein [Bacteroidales bacterium]